MATAQTRSHAKTPKPLVTGIPPVRRRFGRRFFLGTTGALLALFVVLQFVPYGRDHSNPPVTQEPLWDTARTRALAATACFDCHSNQTHWYWYTNIAPISWLVQNDVKNGRASLNFSEWDRPQDGAGDVAEMIQTGAMPPWFYSIIHWGAGLSPTEKRELIDGLRRTFASSPPIGGG